jgi:hypothetical protein
LESYACSFFTELYKTAGQIELTYEIVMIMMSLLTSWSVGFDRPFTQSTLKSLSFWWATLRLPSAAEREGDTFGVLILVSVCQPLFVSATII